MINVLKDEHSIAEKELASKVYYYYDEYYVKRRDIHMYNIKIKELSDLSKKTEKYLRSLKDVYRDSYATPAQLNDNKERNREYRQKAPKYVEFCDKLFELPVANRNNFILASDISLCILSSMFEKYKKRNGKYAFMVDDFFEQYKLFYDEYCLLEKQKKILIDYNKSIAIFNELIDLGFYSISQYVDYICNGYNFDEVKKKIYGVRKKIMKYDAYLGNDNWNSIQKRMDDNKKMSYLILKDRIDRFNEMLRENINNPSFNIIDYYLVLGIPFKNYREICSDFVSDFDMDRFQKFIGKYEILQSYTSFFERVDFNISDDEKAMLYSFLKENSIPECYYNFAVEKYVNGELDNYVNVKKKI